MPGPWHQHWRAVKPLSLVFLKRFVVVGWLSWLFAEAITLFALAGSVCHSSCRSGVNSLYAFLLGSTLLPVAAAYAHDPGAAHKLIRKLLNDAAQGARQNRGRVGVA